MAVRGAGMKTERVTWIAWTGALSLVSFVFAAVCVLLFQGIYWLRFDRWYDWTSPDGPSFFETSQGTRWQGIAEIADWMSSAPMELWTFAAAFILLVLFTVVRISGRR